jgi:mRNA interferase MazF
MESEKDFSQWMPIKQNIQDKSERPFYHEREVWWCSIGLNVGFEADGKGQLHGRPVLIIKDFNHVTFWCIPVTTHIKQGVYHTNINLNDSIARQVVLSQLRICDAKRLRKKMGVVDTKTFLEIKTAIAKILLQ